MQKREGERRNEEEKKRGEGEKRKYSRRDGHQPPAQREISKEECRRTWDVSSPRESLEQGIYFSRGNEGLTV